MSAKKERRIQKDDEVYILSGEHAERNGKVIRLLRESNRVEIEIEGLDDSEKIIKHQRRSQEFPNGTKLYLNPTVHVSNVMKQSRWDERQGSKAKSSPEEKAAKASDGKTKKSKVVESE
jgi:large subunit ribosomal protein L24